MHRRRTLLLLAAFAGIIAFGILFNVLCISAGSSSTDQTKVVRVFYLKGIDAREGITLLRSEVQVRQMAFLGGRDLLIVADMAERVDRSESLLRERDALDKASDPHGPLTPGSGPEDETATRVFRIEGNGTGEVMTILRAIYQIREVEEVDGENSVSVRSAPAVLDASEALLRELDLLVEA